MQQIFAHSYDEQSNVDEKLANGEKDRSSCDVEVVAVEEDGDIIRESGMFHAVSKIGISETISTIQILNFIKLSCGPFQRPRFLCLPSNLLADYTPEQYKVLLKKIDRYLLPLM